MVDDTKPSPRAIAADHAPPSALGDVLFQRGIAVGINERGNVVLVRPDSALVRVPADRTARSRLVEAVGRFQPEGARLVRGAKQIGTVLRVPLGNDGALLRERAWGLARVNAFLAEGAGEWEAEYNSVVIGAQTVVGSPLGVTASWAGDMAFVGPIHQDAQSGQLSLLSSAQPAPEPPPWPEPLALAGRTAPRILVLDTGLRTVAARRAAATAPAGRRPQHTRLAACDVHGDWRLDPTPGVIDDEDEEFDEPAFATAPRSAAAAHLLDFEAGHGTFIAGLLHQQCPDAQIVSAGVLSSFGDGDVADVLSTLADMVERCGPFDLVVMSFGTNLVDDEPGLFGTELMRLLGPALGVAAAGNQATCRPYFPAALPGVVGVGALAPDGKAWFTNYGGWVDACAPGVDVVSTFFEDFDEVIDGTTTRSYRGWARWSGTSFSAPKVAGAIAREMYLSGGTARDAWKRLSSFQRFRYPDLGVVVNV